MGAAELLDVAAPTARASPRGVIAHVRDPLRRDGYALVLNSVLTAVTGLVYWMVAARTYSAHAVGLNSALISAMMFIAGLCGLNLPNVVVRFLGGAGKAAAGLVLGAYAVTGLLAALVATLFVTGRLGWSSRFGFAGSPGLEAWFVVATAGWCLFVIQDSVLTALGRATWVPAENAVFSVLKLGLVAALAGVVPAYGIFASWTVAMVLCVGGVNALLVARILGRPRRGSLADFQLRDADLGRYVAADYVCALAWLASTTLLPVVITAAAGATINAYFALPWAVAFPLYTVATNLGTALVVHGAAGGAPVGVLVRKAAVQGLLLVGAGVALLVALAPQLLGLFGAAYAREGASLMRVLALAAVPNLVLVLAVSAARVRRRLAPAMLALVVQCALTLGLAVPLLHRSGVLGAGLAWLISQSAVALGILAWAGRHAARDRVPAAREVRVAAAVLAREPATAGARFDLRRARTDSDVAVVVAREAGTLRAIVRIARGPAASGRLERGRRALADVRALPGLEDWRALVPSELGAGRLAGAAYVVETALHGMDGREFARDGRRDRAHAAIVDALGPLYAATADVVVAGEGLLDAWVGTRVRALAAHGTDLSAVHAELAERLTGRPIGVGRVHGDLWLGNVLLASDASVVLGLLDWEASEPHGLPAADVAHLLLSTRSLATGGSLGRAARRCLDGAAPLTSAERDLLARADPCAGELEPRLLVLLGWLQHVHWRTVQSEGRPGWRWRRQNLRGVVAE